MRRWILDTDTASDDVWAILAALRAPNLRLEAITTVCGNLPVALCTKNARWAVAKAGRYAVPVYGGSEQPLKNRRDFYAFDCHGTDGLSGLHLPEPLGEAVDRDAVEALLTLTAEAPGELEIACIGPLTNIAQACQKDPDFPRRVKKLWILGGAAGGEGNMTARAEYNNYVDPEAAQIVLNAGFDALWLSWSAAGGGAAISRGELEALANSGGETAQFAADCIRQMAAWYEKEHGGDLAVIDAVLVLAALWPALIREQYPAFCGMCLEPGEDYGVMTVDRLSPSPNAIIAPAIDGAEYRKRLFALLQEE